MSKIQTYKALQYQYDPRGLRIYFGNCEKVNKTHPIEKTVVQFKLHSNPINLWENKYKGKQLYFCLNTIDLSLNTTNLSLIQALDLQKMVNKTDCSPWPLIEIGILTEENCHFKVQNEIGHKYNSDEFIVFQTYILYPKIIGYRLEISTYDENTATIRKIGSSVIYLKNLEGSRGTYTTLIESSGSPIGQTVTDYLFIKPLNLKVNKSADNTMHWKKDQKLNIGHRGSGKMRRLDLDKQVLENTIASFNFAATHGADMVELDVQLTKDKIPIVYHDFYISVSPKNKKEWSHQHQNQQESAELLAIGVNDLTEKQLKNLKLFPESGHTELFRDDNDTDNHPFPSLKQCLKAIVQKAGINIEIKSAMKLKDGTWELDKTIDLNEYIDIILRDILNFSGTRYIIISCFDPDVCSLIQMKQKKFPILFLTQGVTKKYLPYHDPRTSSIPMATYFALNLGITGICAHAEEILNDRNLIKFVKNKNLLLFLWGDDLNSPVVSKSLKEEGVDGIIADEIDKLGKVDSESSKKINYHRYY